MPNAKTKRKIRFREAEERALLEAEGWVFVYSSKMTTDCNGIQLIFGPTGLEAVSQTPPGEQPWEQRDVHQ